MLASILRVARRNIAQKLVLTATVRRYSTAAMGSCRMEVTAAAPRATRTNPTSMMKEALEPSSCTSPVVYADCPESSDIHDAEEPVERMEPEGRPVWMSPVLRWRRIFSPCVGRSTPQALCATLSTMDNRNYVSYRYSAHNAVKL